MAEIGFAVSEECLRSAAAARHPARRPGQSKAAPIYYTHRDTWYSNRSAD